MDPSMIPVAQLVVIAVMAWDDRRRGRPLYISAVCCAILMMAFDVTFCVAGSLLLAALALIPACGLALLWAYIAGRRPTYSQMIAELERGGD